MAWTEASSAAREGPLLDTTNTSNPMNRHRPRSENQRRVERIVNHGRGLERFRRKVFFIECAFVKDLTSGILRHASRTPTASQGIPIREGLSNCRVDKPTAVRVDPLPANFLGSDRRPLAEPCKRGLEMQVLGSAEPLGSFEPRDGRQRNLRRERAIHAKFFC